MGDYFESYFKEKLKEYPILRAASSRALVEAVDEVVAKGPGLGYVQKSTTKGKSQNPRNIPGPDKIKDASGDVIQAVVP